MVLLTIIIALYLIAVVVILAMKPEYIIRLIVTGAFVYWFTIDQFSPLIFHGSTTDMIAALWFMFLLSSIFCPWLLALNTFFFLGMYYAHGKKGW